MAKKLKTVAPVYNMALLAAINAAVNAGGNYYVSEADGLPLVNANPPLIEVNTGMLDAAGSAAARLTDAGKALLAGGNASTSAVEQQPSPFAIITGAALPESKRGNRAGAPTIYPFDQLEIGQSFFVPVSEKTPEPVKTLGSTVSSANSRYAVDTGTTKTVTRTKRGEKNKAVLDAAGNKVKETVEAPVYKYTRKFTIRAVEAGKKYGEWTAPSDGALIARIEVPADQKAA